MIKRMECFCFAYVVSQQIDLVLFATVWIALLQWRLPTVDPTAADVVFLYSPVLHG